MVSLPCELVTLSSFAGSTWQLAFVGVDQLRSRRCPRLAQQFFDRHLAEPRIADVAQHVGVGQLLRFDHDVQRVGTVEAVLPQRRRLHQVQHHQRGNALRVRSNLVDVPAAIRRLDRGHPLGLELGEIGTGKRAALLVGDGQDRVGGLASVKTIAAIRSDQSQ